MSAWLCRSTHKRCSSTYKELRSLIVDFPYDRWIDYRCAIPSRLHLDFAYHLATQELRESLKGRIYEAHDEGYDQKTWSDNAKLPAKYFAQPEETEDISKVIKVSDLTSVLHPSYCIYVVRSVRRSCLGDPRRGPCYHRSLRYRRWSLDRPTEDAERYG